MRLLQISQEFDAPSRLLLYEGLVRGHKVRILVDTGASGHFISSTTVSRLSIRTVSKARADTVRLASGQDIESSQVTRLKFSIDTYMDLATFHVVDLHEDFDLILGKPWLDKLEPHIKWSSCSMRFNHRGKTHHLISIDDVATRQTRDETLIISAAQFRQATSDNSPVYFLSIRQVGPPPDPDPPSAPPSGFPPDWQDRVHATLSRFPDVLPTLHSPDDEVKPTYDHSKTRAIKHEIDIIPGSAPPCRGIYRMAPSELDELKAQLTDLMNRGLIQPSTSPYGAPVLFVKKKNGKNRMVIDYRLLNSITVKNKYPIPRIDDLLDQLHGSTVFSKIDLASGYHQVPIAEGHEHRTAFRTRFGSFEFKVLPFGLCNAPSTFQRMINEVLLPYLDKFVLLYLDDICIYSKTPEEHLQHLEQVLSALRKHNLLAQASKCEFGLRSIDFLGHIVSADGIKVDPAKVKAVMDWPIPTSKHDVLSFKGLAGFYRRFIKDFSKIAAPLSALTGNVPFKWTPIEQASFDALKQALTTAPVLASPDFTKPFIVNCDSSKHAIGAVLMQGGGQDQRVIAYESRKLTPPEVNYLNHDKELLAVIHALKKWRHYLRGVQFKVITDNTAARYIQTKPDLNQRQLRWLDLLQEYNMEIIHRPGRTNVVADALSRRPDLVITAVTRLDIAAPTDFLQKIQHATTLDLEYQRVLAGVTKGTRTDFRLHDSLLYKGERLYVPNCALRQSLLTEAHDTPLGGHLGRDKTYDRLSRRFYWPRLHQQVFSYCTTCPTCQAIKPSHQAPLGLLSPLPIPEAPWVSLSLDLITQLPRTLKGHTAIVVFVCRSTKMIICEPTTDGVTAQQLAQIFHRAVFRHFGMPSSLISDRDPKFTSEFWQSFFRRLGTKFNMSTAHHPQTDGQTERANQTLEDILRAYVSPYHDDWDDHLTTAEFAYNDSVNATTGYTPFYLNYGRHPVTPLTMVTTPFSDSGSEPVRAYAARLREERQLANEAIKKAQERQAKYANLHRRDFGFQVGDKAWLSAAHLRLPLAHNSKKKLTPRFHGPYEIIEVISPVAYKLKLPPSFKIHPVIHISQLKANADGTLDFPLRPEYSPPPPPIVVDNDEYFHVEAFRDHRRLQGKLQFRVKWVGYPESENTWQNASQLQEDMHPELYQDLLRTYLRHSQAAPSDFQNPRGSL